MDLCVIDWKAVTPIIAALIASSIAALTALYISNKWNKQKGGEVIANEAKQVIKDTLELIKTINLIDHSHYKIVDVELEYENFLKTYDSVVTNCSYIDNSIIDVKLSYALDDLSENTFSFKEKFRDLKIKPGSSDLSNSIEVFSESAIKLVDLLTPYSNYRKKCKFKNNGD